MDVLRTPDDAFAGRPGSDFEPQVEPATIEGGGHFLLEARGRELAEVVARFVTGDIPVR